MLIKQFKVLIISVLPFYVLVINLSYAAEFVGGKQCQSCHQEQSQAWQGSHHEKSMQHTNNESVLGDFNQVTFQSNKFFKKGTDLTPEFWVNIKGEDGDFHDYQIKYTFGYTPLQQYMVEFDDGRVQLIPFAWDSRDKENGGQRWFNLTEPKNIKNFSGPILDKIGTTCVQIVTQPTLVKTLMLITIATTPSLVKSMLHVKVAMALQVITFHG